MNGPTAADRARTCYRCSYFGVTAETACPQCRRPLHTVTATRVRGAILVVIGAILMAMMAYMLIWAFAAFNNTGTGVRFTGSEQDKLMIVAIFSTLILFGLVSLITGGWQLILGRRSRLLSWIALAIAAVLSILTGAVIIFM